MEPLPGTKEKGPDKEDPVKFKCAPSQLLNNNRRITVNCRRAFR